ncbi:hypothetical protein [Streptomyces sp. MST-110588]|uniref:hypothetical protein n=1 Tax=Streptomyces sp. MST-110588 TaxID=2833628 RepID=UPI001F5E2781|nr:hypothetical protein [Streptomyces sp. MST-110588]UNO39876.1 hypothetical protein KGS77_10110 [Streptomyces sp. MST-110588]
MPGDELNEGGVVPGARSGPRHAATKRPLLTRLHLPAGKAIALAAMPSAVLMGMGLTPQLAMAKPQPPASPFKDGPCVSAPEKPEKKAETPEKTDPAEKDTEDSKDTKDGKDGKGESQDDKAAKDKSGSGATPVPSPSSSASPSPSSSPSSSSPSPSSSSSPSPSPSASSSTENPWYDPLGLGDKLHDVLHPDKGGEDEPAGPAATPPSPAPSPSASGKDQPPADTGNKPGADGKAGEDAPATTASPTPGPASSASPSPSPSGSTDAGAPDADSKKPFPCVVEKKTDGKDEQTPARIPDRPWHLESTGLTLRGLDYEGVVNLTTPDKKTKQALKFTADSIDIDDLHQIVDGPDGRKYHVASAPGSTSTITGGKVTMYTERLQGKLFGIIPIVFDPEHPPPLNVPFAYFTEVKITQAGQFGGNLTIQGLHQYVEG